MVKRGRLYIVATPLGNLEDITIRALRILKEVFLIAAEDTRRTRKLLNCYNIHTALTSYYEHNEIKKGPHLISVITGGRDIALVTDAGTPVISDPGYRLVKLAVDNSIDVIAVPGPSALIAALSVAGLPANSFVFEGFLPSRVRERRYFIRGLKGLEKTVILYESPRRLKGTLRDILDVLGDVELVIAREITKIYEEVIRGRAGDILEKLEGREIKGEVTLLLAPQKLCRVKGDISVAEELKRYIKAGIRLRDAVRVVVEHTGIPRKVVYKEALSLKQELDRKIIP